MAEHPTWFVGDRNPSISDQLTADGVPVNLSAATVQFRLRSVGATALKVDQPVTTKDASGNWSYAWGATDLNTAGHWLAWLEVTSSGRTQTLWEMLLEVRAHAAAQQYLELEQAKATAELTGTTFADQEYQAAIIAASRAVDEICHRRFYADPNANQVRYYTIDPRTPRVLELDDVTTMTTLATDDDGNGTYETTWTVDRDFVLEPLNAAADGRPYERLRLHPNGLYVLPTFPKSVKVTAAFGWAAVPSAVSEATRLIAIRVVKRVRDAIFGVVALGLEGEAVRIARTDPDVMLLLHNYIRDQVLA